MVDVDNPFHAIIAETVKQTLAAAVKAGGVIPPKRTLCNAPAAERMDIVPDTLSAMRSRGEGPAWSGSGRFVRYEIAEIDRWLLAQPRLEK